MGRTSILTLNEEEREYLKSIIQSSASPARVVRRARVLLLKDKGAPIAAISDIVGLNKSRITHCLKKYKESGLESALCDAPGPGRTSDFSDEEKAWVISIVRQRPNNVGYPAEIWTYQRLTDYVNEKAEEMGYTRLSTISYSSIVNILRQAGIKLKKIRYAEHMHRQIPDTSNFNNA